LKGGIRMGVDTHGYVSRQVTAMDIYNVICSKFDKDAIFDVKVENRMGTEEEIGRIYFKIGEDQRGLFVCYGENENDQKFDFDGNSKYVYLSLGHWNNSEKIMIDIVKCFGGYVDENDCDDIEAFYVPQSENMEYSDYIKEREKIVSILDEKLSNALKMQIASQILKHREQFKEML
jgi:hypothetical protein